MNGVTASALLVFSALYIGVIVRELQPIRSVNEERGREGGGGQGGGQGDGQGGQGGGQTAGGENDGCNKCIEDRCFAKGNSRVVKTIRTETVTERLEEGWAKVSERVVEVVTEEVTEKSKEEEEEVCLRECSEKCKGGAASVNEEKKSGAEKRGTAVGEEESENLKDGEDTSERAARARLRPIRVIPMNEVRTRFQLERRIEDEEEEKSGHRLAEKRSTDEKLDPERPGENQETILVGDEKVVGRRNLDEDSSSGDWKESFEEMGPGLPILKDPLPTGVACCLTRLIQLGLETVTFYLSGLAEVVPLACTERCIYTQEGDNSSFCFSPPPNSSCLTNPGPPVPMDQPSDGESRSQRIPPMGDQGACCPVKQVVGSDDMVGLFILSTSLTALPPSHCLDSCVYNKVGDIRRTKYCFSSGESPTAATTCHRKMPSLATLMDREPDLYQVPTLLDPKSRSKKIVKDSAAAPAEGETPDLPPKTMWIRMKPDASNESAPTVKEVNLGKSKNERSFCKATQVESVQVISLIKSNLNKSRDKTNVNVESESDPVELKQAKPTLANKNKKEEEIESESKPKEAKQATPTLPETKNKKSASKEPQLEPIELKLNSNKIKDSIAKSDQEDMETVTTVNENEAKPVLKSAGESLIPIEIPRVISWAELGVEPLHLTKIKIGPLTETNKWSEKRALDENSFEETETQNKVIKVGEHFSGINGETVEKEQTINAEKKENILEASPKQKSETKRKKVEQDHPVEVQMEELVEVVRIDKEKCEFTTPVMITKIGPVKAQMEELVELEVVRIDAEKCEFTTPVMITKIEKGETHSDKSSDDDKELGCKKNDKELEEPYILAKNKNEGRNNASMIRPSRISENISETMSREGISLKNETAKEDEEKKVATTNETAKVMENINFMGVEKCGCPATDQVPILVLDKLKKIEKVEKVNEVKVEVKIFKVELDSEDSVSDLEDTDQTSKSSAREKPLRLPLTSIRCGGFEPKMPREEFEGRKEEPELVETEHLGKIPVAVNKTALMKEHNLETAQGVNDSKTSRTIPYKVNNAGGGEEPQRVMVTVPYKMPVRISKDEVPGEVPVPLDCHQALPYQLREVPQPVPRSVALEGEMSSGAHRITS